MRFADLNPVAWRNDERVLEEARRLDAGPITAVARLRMAGAIVSLSRFPAVVVRDGMTSGETTGLPLEAQIVARPWREDVAIRLTEELEEVFGLWPPTPGPDELME